MSNTLLDDDEYPYSAKPPTVLKPLEYTPRPRRTLPWKEFRRWTKRLALVAAAALAVAALVLALPLSRARRQAAKIAELERRGCLVTYAPKIWSYDWDDDFPNSLRAWFGDDFASEVGDVNLSRSEDEQAITADDTRTICQICSQFRKQHSFTIHSDSFTFDQIRDWPHLKQLQSLSIRSPNLTDADVHEIAQLSRLKSLDLSSSKLTTAGLAELGILQELKVLSVQGIADGQELPATPSSFPNLISFYIENSPGLSDSSISNLPTMPELTRLRLDGTAVGDKGLARLAAGSKLEEVSVIDTRVTDVGLKSLTSNSNLRMLDVSGTKITDEGLAHLASCSELGYFASSRTNITGRGFEGWTMPNLMLVLDKTQADDEGLAVILKNEQLSHVSVQDTKVTGIGFSSAPRTDPIGSVVLDGMALTAAGLAQLAKAQISSISLSRIPLTDRQLLLFAGNDTITSLNVKETKITEAGVRAFYEARKLRLDAAGQKETLTLECDFPEAVEPYLPKDEFLYIDGSPLDISLPPPEPEQPAPDPPQP